MISSQTKKQKAAEAPTERELGNHAEAPAWRLWKENSDIRKLSEHSEGQFARAGNRGCPRRGEAKNAVLFHISVKNQGVSFCMRPVAARIVMGQKPKRGQ